MNELISRLADRKRPMIMVGDFNCEWTSRKSALLKLSKELNLQAYLPEDDRLNTFPKLNKRLDWILVSPELEFVSYTVLPDVISDHYAVLCEVRRKKD